jgi:hypothetical protein
VGECFSGKVGQDLQWNAVPIFELLPSYHTVQTIFLTSEWLNGDVVM